MLLVALTGGIGSGKSTVAAALASKGAAVIDADRVGREIMEPGGDAYGPVVARFGPGVVDPDGRIDRAALAAVVFADRGALGDLNGLTHPAMARIMADRASALAAEGADIIVIDIALLNIVSQGFKLGAVLVVDAPEEVAVRRLMEHRGFTETDARSRVAAQIGREERRGIADLVITNAGDRDALDEEIDRAWAWLSERAAAQV